MRKHGPPIGWLLARGLHRKVMLFLWLAACIGVLAGMAFHQGAGTHGWICLGVAVLFSLWPISWLATMRIAWPLRELARVATELHGGQLSSRERLPEGPNEVGEVAHALRGMADRVARQLKDQRSLMAAVSHELRSPLGRLRVMVELVREGHAPPSALDEIQAEIDGMDALVGDLLAAARIDFEAVSLKELSMEEVARRALQQAGLPDEALKMEGRPPPLKADPTLLLRAMGVVLDNARRYGGQQILLRIRPRQGWIRLEVEDDGPGFQDPEMAFQPFYRGPPGTQPAPRGEGLGLSLVRQIAEAHQGQAGAENRREGGARVWMELPIPREMDDPEG